MQGCDFKKDSFINYIGKALKCLQLLILWQNAMLIAGTIVSLVDMNHVKTGYFQKFLNNFFQYFLLYLNQRY